MRHPDIIGPQAVHEFAFVQNTDPALVPANEVAANVGWLNTAFNPPVLQLRNSGNTAWLAVSAT